VTTVADFCEHLVLKSWTFDAKGYDTRFFNHWSNAIHNADLGLNFTN